MTKIYEALQHAYRSRKGTERTPALPIIKETCANMYDVDMEEEMLGLFKTIDSILAQDQKWILQFIGTRKGEGTSTIIREFARVAATKIRKSVLLLDADRLNPSQHLYFGIHSDCGWQESVKEEINIDKMLHQIGETSLFLGASSNSRGYTPEIFDSGGFEAFWQNLWERFDLILVDSPPLTSSPDGLALAPKMSGTILIVEAEKSRWPTVKNAHARITQVGGKVLGIVFNKRRYYIPQAIYKHLI
ncbi:MAG: CpsD/CapB family tyrosine-protein kinase, partial [Desulfoferrobacter sp.]